jgi:hypothetical protein
MVDPAGQAYPAEQFAVHVAAPRPVLPPNLPGDIRKPRHTRAHTFAGTTPHRNRSCTHSQLSFQHTLHKEHQQSVPAGQSVQLLTPPKLYLPRAQMLARVFDAMDAAGQAYPGAQSPVQAAVCKPCVPPNLPAGQSVQLLAAAADEYRPTAHRVHDPVPHKATEDGRVRHGNNNVHK